MSGIFEIDAWAHPPGQPATPFALLIEGPERYCESRFVCYVTCKFLKLNRTAIYSSLESDGVAMGLHFVRAYPDGLDVELQDDDGNPVVLGRMSFPSDQPE